MHLFSSTLLALAGVINFLPIIGVLSRTHLEQAYGVVILSNDLELLLRHRAVLLGLIGGVAILGALKAQYFYLAAMIAFISMVSYALLFHLLSIDQNALAKVLYADYAGIALVIGAIGIRFHDGRTI